MPNNFNEVAPGAPKNVKIAGMRIAPERLLHLQGQAVHALSHVRPSGRPPATPERPKEPESWLRQCLHHRRRQRHRDRARYPQTRPAGKRDLDHWRGATPRSLLGRRFNFLRRRHQHSRKPLAGISIWVEDLTTKERSKVIPGELRHRYVAVGRHLPASPPAIPRFLRRFEEVYSELGKTETILAAVAAHHRLAWIHPFLEGNGRVARLMSHAILEALDTGAVWSIARGLARNVDTYKAACDLPRRNDLDGRGHLSEENLAAFTHFFLAACLDQVSFMESLVRPDRLRARILLWTEDEIRLDRLPPRSGAILEAVLYRGELPRSDTTSIVGTGERQARRILLLLVLTGEAVLVRIKLPQFQPRFGRSRETQR
jgi:hypothetical protein